MGSQTYVRESVRNVEAHLTKQHRELKTKVSSPLPTNYAPELDASPLCDDDDVAEYHSRIGVLRWAVELGRVDICAEVSIMAAYSANPRVGHLDAVYHIFAWLKKHDRSMLVFDSAHVNNKEQSLPDWTDFYKDVKEQIPADAPEPLGKPVEMTSYIDSDHAGDKVTTKVVANWSLHLSQQSFDYLVQQEAIFNRDVFIWIRVLCHENWNRVN